MKRIISLLLLSAVLISMLSFASSAKVEGWTCLGAKWSTGTGMIIENTNDHTVKDHGFGFSFTADGSLLAEVPDYATLSGGYGTALVSGDTQEALDGLTVVIKPEDFDFTLDENKIGDQISFLWTESKITEIADPINSEGLMHRDMIYNKGLRNIMPVGKKGLCITLGNTNKNNNEEGTLTASDLCIVYYDGEQTDDNGNLGKEWRFTRFYRYGSDDIMPLSLDHDPLYTGEYVNIDISYGLIINIISDDKLGYIVNVNGKDYVCEDDEIDLSGLKSVKRGYITAGIVSNANYQRTGKVSIRLSSVNGMTAKYWSDNGNTPVIPCLHDYEKRVVKEADCENDGTYVYSCILCHHSYSESIPALGHTSGEWEVIKEATREEEGERIKKCTVCGKILEREFTSVVFPQPPDPDMVFTDVSKKAWYYESVLYCFKKGYIVGDEKGYFRPEHELSREQFVTMLARVAKADLSEYTDSPFIDVEANSWYGSAVIWAYENGYVKGIGNDKFGVGESITRESLAVLMYRYAQADAVNSSLDTFVDGDSVSDWARKEMSWAVTNKILGSTSENANILAPKMTVTRAQAAQIFMNYDKRGA